MACFWITLILCQVHAMLMSCKTSSWRYMFFGWVCSRSPSMLFFLLRQHMGIWEDWIYFLEKSFLFFKKSKKEFSEVHSRQRMWVNKTNDYTRQEIITTSLCLSKVCAHYKRFVSWYMLWNTIRSLVPKEVRFYCLEKRHLETGDWEWYMILFNAMSHVGCGVALIWILRSKTSNGFASRVKRNACGIPLPIIYPD